MLSGLGWVHSHSHSNRMKRTSGGFLWDIIILWYIDIIWKDHKGLFPSVNHLWNQCTITCIQMSTGHCYMYSQIDCIRYLSKSWFWVKSSSQVSIKSVNFEPPKFHAPLHHFFMGSPPWDPADGGHRHSIYNFAITMSLVIVKGRSYAV